MSAGKVQATGNHVCVKYSLKLIWWTGRDLNPRPPPLSDFSREGGIHTRLNYRPLAVKYFIFDLLFDSIDRSDEADDSPTEEYLPQSSHQSIDIFVFRCFLHQFR